MLKYVLILTVKNSENGSSSQFQDVYKLYLRRKDYDYICHVCRSHYICGDSNFYAYQKMDIKITLFLMGIVLMFVGCALGNPLGGEDLYRQDRCF